MFAYLKLLCRIIFKNFRNHFWFRNLNSFFMKQWSNVSFLLVFQIDDMTFTKNYNINVINFSDISCNLKRSSLTFNQIRNYPFGLKCVPSFPPRVKSKCGLIQFVAALLSLSLSLALSLSLSLSRSLALSLPLSLSLSSYSSGAAFSCKSPQRLLLWSEITHAIRAVSAIAGWFSLVELSPLFHRFVSLWLRPELDCELIISGEQYNQRPIAIRKFSSIFVPRRTWPLEASRKFQGKSFRNWVNLWNFFLIEHYLFQNVLGVIGTFTYLQRNGNNNEMYEMKIEKSAV